MYQLETYCERCGRKSVMLSPSPDVSMNCGDCLMKDVDIVPLKIRLLDDDISDEDYARGEEDAERRRATKQGFDDA